MSGKLRLTLAQLNPTVGDFAGNIAKAQAAHAQAAAAGAPGAAGAVIRLSWQPMQETVSPGCT